MLMEQWNADLTGQGKYYFNHQVGVWQAAIQEFKLNKTPYKQWDREPQNTAALDSMFILPITEGKFNALQLLR